jgi:hypothetical protein
MTNGSKALCPACNRNIVPGTIYCWRHTGDAPKVGAFGCDEGHLVWSSAGTRGRAERCIAVLVDGRQVVVRDVEVSVGSPVKLALQYVEVGQTAEARADIVLDELVEKLIDGWESVNATPRSSS